MHSRRRRGGGAGPRGIGESLRIVVRDFKCGSSLDCRSQNGAMEHRVVIKGQIGISIRIAFRDFKCLLSQSKHSKHTSLGSCCIQPHSWSNSLLK